MCCGKSDWSCVYGRVCIVRVLCVMAGLTGPVCIGRVCIVRVLYVMAGLTGPVCIVEFVL